MRYLSFTIKNYKGVDNTTISLGKGSRVPITTLIGLNESGKTTLLEAINSFGYGTADISHLDIYGYAPPDPFDLVPIAKRSNFNGDIAIEVSVELEKDDITALSKHLLETEQWTCTTVNPKMEVSHNWTFTDSVYKEEQSLRTWSLDIQGKRNNSRRKPVPLADDDVAWNSATEFLAERMPKIWYFPNFLFDFPSKVYLENFPELTGSKEERNTFFRSLIQAALREVDPTATIEKHLLARATSKDLSDKKALDSLCLKLGRNLTANVFGAWSKTIKSHSRPRSIKFSVTVDEAGHPFVTLQIEDSDGIFEIGDRSLGFRWFFVFLLITQYVISRTPNSSRSVLLLDEPASNLHPTAQQRLLEYFSHLAANVTLVYATHSHHLIDPTRLEAAYVIRNRGLSNPVDDIDFKSFDTKVEALPYRTFVGSHPDQTAYFQPVLDILEVKPSNLEHLPSIVLVEGKSDYYLLNLLFKSAKVGDGFSIYPGGGAGTLDTVIALYLAWARPFVVLLDSDAEGRKQKSRYIDRFSGSIESRIFTLAEAAKESESFSLESLLSPADVEALSKAAFGTSDKLTKKQFLVASQTCLIEKTVPQFTSKLLTRVSAIDAQLRKALAV